MLLNSPIRKTTRVMARGFSMLELTFVLVVIGVLLATAALNYNSFMVKGKIGATKKSLLTIKEALDSYNAQQNGYPATLAILAPEFLERNKMKDGWKGEFYYELNTGNVERPFDLRSAGADRVIGTSDDIDVWNMDNDAPRTN